MPWVAWSTMAHGRGCESGEVQGTDTLGRVCWQQQLIVAFNLLGAPECTANPALPLPLQLTAAEVRRLEAAEGGRDGLVDSLDSLKQQVANVE